MSSWFFLCGLGLIVILPLYILSHEHVKLQEKFGKGRGTKIGDILGMISGWGFFIFLIGIWLSPQPKFTIPVFQDLYLDFPQVYFSVPMVHLVLSIPFLIVAVFLGIIGVKDVSLKVAETHRPEKVITTGTYSIVRHPQYVASLIAHVAISFFLSALYSLLVTPLIVFYVYIISRNEEKMLIRTFGEDYEDYIKKVPMMIPRLKKR
ncbi:MAG: methyltransferase family protein [Candidatus Hodarchaeales archaeon]|jgi:protein-S-isoprenylcysteine O-methyltransferase Ste14